MGAGAKHARAEEEVSLALSLSADSSSSSSSSDSGAAAGAGYKKARRRGRVAATSGEGEFVCQTCSRAFTSFQALGGHRTSHLRGRHGLELSVGARAIRERQRKAGQQHQCHICGLGFEMGQALGGHMRRHREEAMGGAAAADADSASDAWVWRSVALHDHAGDPPALLELFV